MCPDWVFSVPIMDMFRKYSTMVFRSPVAWMFLTTGLRIGGFFLIMGYALRILSPEDMGLWFVLTNLTGFACAVELGFNTAIARTASYLLGGMSRIPPVGGLQGSSISGQPNYPELAGLINMSRRLYRWFAGLVGIILFVAGGAWFVFIKPDYLQGTAQWVTFWLIGLGTVINMASLFWWPLLFGLNRVRQYNQLQIGGLLSNYAVSFTGLRFGLGLPILAIGAFLFNFVPRQASRRQVLNLIPPDAFRHSRAISWRSLWPITWRTGLVNLASLMMVSATTLVCAQMFDLRTAASYGLCMQFGLMLHSLSQSWLVVKYPELSVLRARGESLQFNRIVRQRILFCMASYALGATALVIVLPFAMGLIHSNTPALEPALLALLLLAIGLDLMLNLHAAVLITSENATPHLFPFLITGILTVALAFILSGRWGVAGLITAPLLAQAAFTGWWVPLRCWRHLRAAIQRDYCSGVA